MTRRHEPAETLDPATAADLAALDAALAGERSDAEWTALVAAMREATPAPRRAAAEALDARVAAGFPRWGSAAVGRAVPRLPARRLLPALAVASTLIAGGVVVATNLGGSENAPVSSSAPSGEASSEAATDGAVGATAERESDGATAQRGSEATPPAAPGDAAAGSAPLASLATPSPPAAPGRRVERSTTLELTTDARGLQDAADGIVRATQDLGGVVTRSLVDAAPAGGTATFALRIPTARLADALKRFGALADVARISQASEDITASFVSAQDRLTDARAERKALLRALGKATTPGAIASLRARIAGNRGEIARAEGDLRGLRGRTDRARVDVTLSARGRAVDPDAGGSWGPGDAARDAGRVLGLLAGGALVAGAVLAPFALAGGAAALGTRSVRRRRRDAALSPS